MSRFVYFVLAIITLSAIASSARSEDGYPARPVGVWERVVKQDDEAGKLTFYIMPQRIHWTIIDSKTKSGLLLSGDYSVSKDSVLYGLLSSVEPYVDGKTDLDPDQMFRFRFRIDGEYLTVKDFNMPGQPDVKSLMAGRYRRIAATAHDPQPPSPVKGEQSLPTYSPLSGGALGAATGALIGASNDPSAELLPAPKIEPDDPR